MAGKKYLIVKGVAGLGNRLISLCDAIHYARRTGRILLVDWCDGLFAPRGRNAFPLFFELKGVDSISSFDDIRNLEYKSAYPPLWGEMPEKPVYDLFRRGESRIVNRTVLRNVFRGFLARGAIRKLQRHWYVYTEKRKRTSHTLRHAIRALFSRNDFCFGSDLSFGLRQDLVFYVDHCPSVSPDIVPAYVEPSREVRAAVDRFCAEHELAGSSIGVHVRMTDKQPTQDLRQLVEAIDDIPLKNPKLFLATDSESAVAAVKARFPGVITIDKVKVAIPDGVGRHYFAKRFDRGDVVEAMAFESILDMFVLARCEYLIAQKNSSFSRISAVFKNDPTKTMFW